MEGVDKEDVSIISDPTFANVSKLAINFSDAVIKGTKNINTEVEKYIRSTNKLYLDYQPKETYIDSYNEFYDKVF